MFTLDDVEIGAACREAEAVCGPYDARNCDAWLPTSWCGGPDNPVNNNRGVDGV